MDNPRTFWDTFENLYQMGSQKHRLYLLDLLQDKNVLNILDVGCGTGPIYELIEQYNYPFAYKGVDYSPAMIEIAKNHFRDGDFEVQDARSLMEEDNKWDCVLLMHCLDHVNDYKSVIREAARAAKDYVCIVLWRPFVTEGDRLNDRNMMGKKEGEAPWEDTYLHEYSRESLETAFMDNGLIIDHIAEGEEINSDASHYNFLYLLKKEPKWKPSP